MMMTQNGKLLYISDNAAEYLGHSMVSTVESRMAQQVSHAHHCTRGGGRRKVKVHQRDRRANPHTTSRWGESAETNIEIVTNNRAALMQKYGGWRSACMNAVRTLRCCGVQPMMPAAAIRCCGRSRLV